MKFSSGNLLILIRNRFRSVMSISKLFSTFSSTDVWEVEKNLYS